MQRLNSVRIAGCRLMERNHNIGCERPMALGFPSPPSLGAPIIACGILTCTVRRFGPMADTECKKIPITR